MEDFFKYLAPTPEEKNWGIWVTVAGCSKVAPGMNYPPGGHPQGYHFRWENGRILNEYQIVYVTEGEGIFETKQESHEIKPGSLMLLHPGVWHRYRPDTHKGWVEWYIGFRGDAVPRFMSHPLLQKSTTIRIGLRENLLESYRRVLRLVRDESQGFQLIASGEAVRMIAYTITNIQSLEFEGKPVEETISKAKYLIQQKMDQKADWVEIATTLNLGYTNFRKMFKKYTGLSPGQYHLNLRLVKAKELLLHSSKSLKEIAWETGFYSESYFSRIYREKMGQSPSFLRK
jgi:AraC-like DNA-binding protein